MDKDGFRSYLQSREIPIEQIEQSIAIVGKYETFLEDRSLESSTFEDGIRFTQLMIDERTNTYDNFIALLRYGFFVKNNDMYLVFLGWIDGGEVIDVLHEKLGQVLGDKKRDEVFEEFEMPPLGMPSDQKAKVTQELMTRMEALVDPTKCKRALIDTAHGIPRKYHEKEREKFLEAGSIDIYLERRRDAFLEQIVKHRDEGSLFFNQEITDDVIEFVKNNPGVGAAVRDGDKIIHIKIPYMTKEYLVEKDDKMKRYYACHCPWARESIVRNDIDVSANFCYCSAGFTVQPLEVALDRSLDIEMIESALKGDGWCKFVIQLPEDVE